MKILLHAFCALMLLVGGMAQAAEPISIELDPERTTDLTVEEVGDGEYRLIITGKASQVYTRPIDAEVDPKRYTILSFEYFSVQEIGLVVYPGPQVTRNFRLTATLPLAEGWSQTSVDLTALEGVKLDPNFGFFRLHFIGREGLDFRIRNIQLREATEEEIRLQGEREAMREADRAAVERIEAYLNTTFPGVLLEAHLVENEIRLRGTAPEGQSVQLAALPLWLREFEPGALNDAAVETWPVPAGDFSLSLPRYGEPGVDRLLMRFGLIADEGAGRALASPLRYVDPTPHNEPQRRPKPASIKGLGGLDAARLDEYLELGVKNVGINVLLGNYLLPREQPGAIRWEYAGETFWMNPKHVEKLDEQMRLARMADFNVDLVLLLEKPSQISFPEIRRALVHPDFTSRGIHAMPNITDPQGVKFYAAVIDFLAARYDGSNDEFATAKDWVVHNEVDAAIVWTNAGEKSMGNFMDLYHRSMRLMHNLARARIPEAEVLISLTHRWTESRANIYAPRELLERLVKYSHWEGDFRWGIAQHPYPTNLFNPRTWEDPRTEFTLDTPLITFRNLEVLDHWLRLPQNRYKGEIVRSLCLTEQGLNSWGLDEKALRDQAAGLAYAWNKIKRLDSVRVFIYHRWVDHPNEGGLQIGLRQNAPGTTQEPGDKKPAWDVFQALGTPDEDAATAFAKEVIGINDWEEIMFQGVIK